LDYIWISNNLISEIVYNSTNKPHIFTIDHKAVIAYFKKDQIFQNHSMAIRKRYNTEKVIDYLKTTEDTWNKFTQYMKKMIGEHKNYFDFLPSRININNL
jgi:hypothetical protein